MRKHIILIIVLCAVIIIGGCASSSAISNSSPAEDTKEQPKESPDAWIIDLIKDRDLEIFKGAVNIKSG